MEFLALLHENDRHGHVAQIDERKNLIIYDVD